jgi:FkbM family methyltransferase
MSLAGDRGPAVASQRNRSLFVRVSSGLLTPLLRGYVRYAPGSAGKAMLAQRLVTRFRSHPDTKVTRTRWGPRLRVTIDDLLQGYLYLFGLWEPNISHWVRRTLQPGDTFVDVGANIGYFTVLASDRVAAHGGVVAIEASPAFTEAMRANVALNGCGNVRIVNAAVSDGCRPMAFYQPYPYNRGNTTSVGIESSRRPLFTIESTTLPDVLNEAELRRARLVKIDVEGAEYATICGLVPVLSRMREDVELIVEINPDLLVVQGTSAAELVDLLASHGFHAYRVANGYCVPDYVPRRPPSPPQRWRSPVTELSDFVFSRKDAESL